jgi:hypothetical protein
MSTNRTPRTHESSNLDRAIQNIEEAIGALESEQLFREELSDDEERELEEERFSIAAEELDQDAIAHHTTELETSLDIAADLLTDLVEPNADEALSLGEILARQLQKGVLQQQSVETADKLLECLSSTIYAPGDRGFLKGLRIGYRFSYTSLQKLVSDLRKLAQHLASE